MPIDSLESLATDSASAAIGFALGFAAAEALRPVATTIGQDAWAVDPSKALDAETAAGIAVEDVDAYDPMQTEATYTGIGQDRFKLLYDFTLTAPGLGDLLTFARRGTATPDDFTYGLRKAKLNDRFDRAYADLQTARIPVADLAYMVVRGLVNDAGLLPVPPPATVETIARYPVATLDTLKEAAAWGWDEDRFRALVGRSGLSMAPTLAAHAHFRGEIGLNDFYLAIAEGDLRNEWRDAILAASRAIPTPHEYEEAALRGVLSPADADAGAARSGMDATDAQLLFEIMGRSLAVHAITTGIERGGEYGGTYDDIPEPYRDAVRRSNIRPEYAKLAYANRYTIPSYFILRAILQDGGMSADDFAQYGKDLGWPPDLADKAAKALDPGKGTKAGPHTLKAQTQLWNTTHKSFVADEIEDAVVRDTLPKAGVTADEIDGVLTTWTAERALIRRQLTAAQIKKAIGQPGKDKAWALERLADLGYNADDSETFLAE